ncbi:MAG: dephospho-CoA kinase [Chloroflexi bacterium]|nr:dephospho-CoA kinase [Chloroflexota bacterium]
MDLYHRSKIPLAFLIGLTGGIACGKSAVGKLLRNLGADYIDADHLVHELLGPGGAAVEAVLARFGAGVRQADGGIDRRALGAIVFGDPPSLRDLECLLHPAVRAEARRRIAASRASVVVVDAIKLIEGGLAKQCDSVWVVTCPPDLQQQRLIALRGMSSAEADARLVSQPNQATRLPYANVVIDNAGTLEELEAQVRRAWQATVPRPTDAG